MTVENVRELLHASPFLPFSLRLADGRTIPVRHPDFASASETGRLLHVFHGPQDASSFVDVLLVTAVEIGANGSTQTKSL